MYLKALKKHSFVILLMTFFLATQAFAKDMPQTQSKDFYIGLYPQSVNISFGAKDMPYQLSYNVVKSGDLTASVPITVDLPSPLPKGIQFKTNDKAAFDYYHSYYNCTSQTHPGKNTYFDPTQPKLSMTLPAGVGSVCNVYLTFWATNDGSETATSPFNLTFKTQNTTAESKTTLSYATGKKLPDQARKIQFVNSCSYPVTLAISGGAVQAKNSTDSTCSTGQDCYPGSTCVNINPSKGIKQCMWTNPVPSNGYKLSANGGTSEVSIPIYDDGINLAIVKNVDLIWSGAISGRLNCTGTSCKVNDCGVDPTTGKIGACDPSKGIGTSGSPVSQVEITLEKNTPIIYSNMNSNDAKDTYDLTLINGITVPMSISPTNAEWDAQKPYDCGSPGLGDSQTKPLGSCSWSFLPPQHEDYRWVAYESNPTPCSPTKTCASSLGSNTDKVCGLMHDTSANSVIQACGLPITYDAANKTYVGPKDLYWTADQVCGSDKNFKGAFNCSESVSKLPNNVNNDQNQFHNLYGCSAVSTAINDLNQTCYGAKGGSSATCCGCIDWWTIDGIEVPNTTESCKAESNPGWRQQALPTLQWIKTGCPTAYIYPFDDKSSTFTCMVNKKVGSQGNLNTTNYKVEFCPS